MVSIPLKIWFRKKVLGEKFINALFVYPNNAIEIKEVPIGSNTFTLKDKSYTIDQTAIYHYKGKPILLYHSENASPKKIGAEAIENSMTASEINAVLEQKAVRDLLLAALGVNDKLFWIMVANTVMTLVLLLNELGIVHLGKKVAGGG